MSLLRLIVRSNGTLQSQVSGLKLELAELRGELKAKSALAEMEARLMRLETPTRLKTVG